MRIRLPTNKILLIIIVGAILGAIAALGYDIATPRVGEKFTEFYVLGLEGKAADYPSELKPEEQGRVIVGVINREREVVSYRVKVEVNGVSVSEIGPLTLAHDGKWEEMVSFTPDSIGNNQKVEFLLYKSGESEPYRQLRLLIDVKE